MNFKIKDARIGLRLGRDGVRHGRGVLNYFLLKKRIINPFSFLPLPSLLYAFSPLFPLLSPLLSFPPLPSPPLISSRPLSPVFFSSSHPSFPTFILLTSSHFFLLLSSLFTFLFLRSSRFSSPLRSSPPTIPRLHRRLSPSYSSFSTSFLSLSLLILFSLFSLSFFSMPSRQV